MPFGWVSMLNVLSLYSEIVDVRNFPLCSLDEGCLPQNRYGYVPFCYSMRSDIDNMRKMMGLLGDEGFVNALTNAEKLVNDAEQTLDRVEKIEGDAEQAVREANTALQQVDNRLSKFDETISLLEAKIEAGFSVGFFFFALSQWTQGNVILAAALAFMGLLGASSLVVTVLSLPQVKKLRKVGEYATDQVDRQRSDWSGWEREREERERQRRNR